jgi:hypothetical protein
VAEAQQIFNTVNENGWVNSPAQWGELQQVGFVKHTYRDEVGEDIYAGFSIKLLVQEEFIEVINVNVSRNVAFDLDAPEYDQIGERLVRDWEQFSLQNMFEQFGNPDLIYLLPRNFADGDNFFYELNIYYPSFGIAASYSFDLLGNEQSERTVCMDVFNLNSMTLFLYAPLSELPSDYLQATYSLWPLNSGLKPEDAQIVALSDVESRTGMSIDEFVMFVLENGSNGDCVTVNQ